MAEKKPQQASLMLDHQTLKDMHTCDPAAADQHFPWLIDMAESCSACASVRSTHCAGTDAQPCRRSPRSTPDTVQLDCGALESRQHLHTTSMPQFKRVSACAPWIVSQDLRDFRIMLSCFCLILERAHVCTFDSAGSKKISASPWRRTCTAIATPRLAATSPPRPC